MHPTAADLFLDNCPGKLGFREILLQKPVQAAAVLRTDKKEFFRAIAPGFRHRLFDISYVISMVPRRWIWISSA
jgi:hypothetical protein